MNLDAKYDILLGNGEVGNFSLREILSNYDKTILYFYPKDNTPGCTLENKDFTCLRPEFLKAGINIIGVSKDSLESHKKFLFGSKLTNPLISDPDLTLHKEFGAYGEKNNYGKIVMGVIRSTFLLSKDGEILKEWKGIKATGHAERLYKELLGNK